MVGQHCAVDGQHGTVSLTLRSNVVKEGGPLGAGDGQGGAGRGAGAGVFAVAYTCLAGVGADLDTGSPGIAVGAFEPGWFL